MERKKLIKYSVGAFILLLLCVFGIRMYQENAFMAPPDYYYIYASKNDSDQNHDLQSIFIKNNKRTYHINSSKKYLTSQGSHVYVTGNYYHSFFKPTVYLDGEKIKVTTDGNGGMTEYGRLYHFYIENVVPDRKYKISFACGKRIDYINVVFHYS